VKVPPELVASLRNSAPHGIRDAGVTRELWLINSAYAAGADQELEACCEWLGKAIANNRSITARALRAARRPKPPTLAEQGLKALGPSVGLKHFRTLSVAEQDDIRAALTRLAELEAQQ
jgi:hypothetical protein